MHVLQHVFLNDIIKLTFFIVLKSRSQLSIFFINYRRKSTEVGYFGDLHRCRCFENKTKQKMFCDIKYLNQYVVWVKFCTSSIEIQRLFLGVFLRLSNSNTIQFIKLTYRHLDIMDIIVLWTYSYPYFWVTVKFQREGSRFREKMTEVSVAAHESLFRYCAIQ